MKKIGENSLNSFECVWKWYFDKLPAGFVGGEEEWIDGIIYLHVKDSLITIPQTYSN